MTLDAPKPFIILAWLCIWTVQAAAAEPITAHFIRDLIVNDQRTENGRQVTVAYSPAVSNPSAIIFSHGHSMSKDDYDPLFRAWAEAGFIVLATNHLDSFVIPTEKRPSGFTFFEERVLDLVVVLDAIPQIVERLSSSKIEFTLPAQIVAAGHSYGGLTAQSLAGAITYAEGSAHPRQYIDDRVSAVISISGSAHKDGDKILTRFIRSDTWKSIRKPMLVFSGTNEPFSWDFYAAPFKYGNPGNNYFALIEGADHFYGGIFSPPQSRKESDTQPQFEQLNCLVSISLGFLNSLGATEEHISFVSYETFLDTNTIHGGPGRCRVFSK